MVRELTFCFTRSSRRVGWHIGLGISKCQPIFLFSPFQSAKIDKKSRICKKNASFLTFFKIIFCQCQKKVVILCRISQKRYVTEQIFLHSRLNSVMAN